MLTPNTPIKRLEYVAKTYGDRSPGVVMDTFFLLSDVVGIESPHRLSVGTRVWNHVGFHPGAMRIPRRRLMWRADPNAPLAEIALPDDNGDELVSFAGDPSQVALVDSLLETLRDHPAMQRGRESDALWPWVAQQLNKGKKRALRTGNPYEYVDILNSLYQKGSALALWQQQENIDLGRYDWHEAIAALNDFEVDSGDEGISQGEVLYEWPDGWTVQRLEADQLEEEGEVMQHCVGTYCETVESGETEIHSLRDPKGEPHVTIEVIVDLNRAVQVQGKQNRKPIPEYQKRVDQYFKKTRIKDALTDSEHDRLRSAGASLANEQWAHEEQFGDMDDPRQTSGWAYEKDTLEEIRDNRDVIKRIENIVDADFGTIEHYDAFLEQVIESVEDGADSEWANLVDEAVDRIEEAIHDAKMQASEYATNRDEAEETVLDVLGDANVNQWIDEGEFHRIVDEVERDSNWDGDEDEEDDSDEDEEDW